MEAPGVGPSKNTLAQRLPRRYPYFKAHPPAASSVPGESSSPSSPRQPTAARDTISSEFRTPRNARAPGTSSLQYVPVVRVQHGLPAPRSSLIGLTAAVKRDCARRLLGLCLDLVRPIQLTTFQSKQGASSPADGALWTGIRSGTRSTHTLPPKTCP